MKVWITKYALTQGIFEKEGEIDEDISKKMVVIKNNIIEIYYNGDWHVRSEDALKKAEQMRIKKIKNLQKQIEKMEKLSF